MGREDEDRKTAQRYIDAAQEFGLTRSGGDEQLTDEFVGRVRQVVRPSRAGAHGTSWELLTTHEEQIKQWVDDDLTVAKIGDLLELCGNLVFNAMKCGSD
ncbi:MAG: hypothetical protein HKL87_01695 [Acidimicrobiaceae bacterium]|nr:hypothetical protein [Acidimicrobiaceae bacterium]